MSEFAGQEYDFAAGSLHGLRGWNMDEKGRLHGVSHAEVWTPGENTSVCKAKFKVTRCPGPTRSTVNIPKINKRTWFGGEREAISLGPASMYSVEAHFEPCRHSQCDGYQHYDKAEDAHRFDPNCTCGFWAYDERGFKAQGFILGVIEAFGKTTIGTKGFRAERARIVGLSRQSSDNKPLSLSVLTRLATLYPEVLFYDDLDQMVAENSGVLHNWPEVGEDFWSVPVPVKNDVYPYSMVLNSLNSSLSSMRFSLGGLA